MPDYAALAAAVIGQAVRDAYGKWAPPAARASAHAFLVPDNPLLGLYGDVLGCQPGVLAERAARYGGRQDTRHYRGKGQR